jgi:hypothetical protein
MNVIGEKKIGARTYREFMIRYYDEDGNAIYYEGYHGD